MKIARPLRLAVAGIAAYVGAVLWVFLYHEVASRNDPPGWVVDRATPDGPKLLAILGASCVFGGLLWATVRLVRSANSQSKR